MDSACHVIERILNPHSLDEMESYDVVSTAHQPLTLGCVHYTWREHKEAVVWYTKARAYTHSLFSST